MGYVGERTFARVLAAVDDPSRVRVVSFVLRTIDPAGREANGWHYTQGFISRAR